MAAESRRGVLVLGGPTASGKTAFAIALAERYDAEIVGADSRQIYRDMQIGTAAPTAEQRARIRHHLIAWLDPYERYSAARFVADAAAAIAAIQASGKRAIVVGGTGFYLRALCGEVDLASEPDPTLRARVVSEAQIHPPDVLHDWLRSRDPRRAAAVAPHDAYRVARALEIAIGSSLRHAAPPATRSLPTLRATQIPYKKLVLRADRLALANRIAQRTETMLADGLIEEAERIGGHAIAADAVGYREALAYQNGWLTFAELRATLARATRRYAKRQLTWFHAESNVTWLDAGDIVAADEALKSIGWLPVCS